MKDIQIITHACNSKTEVIENYHHDKLYQDVIIAFKPRPAIDRIPPNAPLPSKQRIIDQLYRARSKAEMVRILMMHSDTIEIV